MLVDQLKSYPFQIIATELKDGFTHGFRLNYTGPREHRESPNLVSASEHKQELLKKVQSEIDLGRIVGPFDRLPLPNLQVSPIGVVPKSDGISWRLITHLSFPRESGINDFIDPDLCSVKYTSFDRVVEMISSLGQHAEMAVVDIKSAFRLLPVHPDDFELLGFKIDGHYYVDKNLPMGCKISCNYFEKFSTFLHFLVEKKSGKNTLDHYLDDFIFAGKSLSGDCKLLRDSFLSICESLSVPLAVEKSLGPTTVLKFLGLIIDTDQMLIRVPDEKVAELSEKLRHYLTRKRITLRELQSLVGSLNFFSKAVRCARAFNRRFYDLTLKAKLPHHSIKLSPEVKADMQVWLQFLNSFNGVAYFPEGHWSDSSVLHLYTDSSKLAGGAYFSKRWVCITWPLTWKDADIIRDITFLEFIPVVLALVLWGHLLQNKKIVLHIDNLALVEILNKQSSRSKRIMDLMRLFVTLVLQHNIVFRSFHIPGLLNEISDSISRQEWNRFRALAPEANTEPEQIPSHFRDLIYNMKLTD